MSGTFIFIVCLSLAVFFSGGICGCCAMIFAGHLRKRAAAHWATAICFFLTIIVAATTVALIFGDWRKVISDMSLSFRTILFYGSIFACGILVCALYRVCVPVGIVLLLACTSFALHTLRNSFGQQQTLAILKIQTDSCTIDDHVFAANFAQISHLKLNVCHIPDTVILPIPRIWYDLHDDSVEFQRPHSYFFLLNWFYSIIYADVRVEEFEMPYPLVYPDVYSVHFSQRDGKLRVRFVKAF